MSTRGADPGVPRQTPVVRQAATRFVLWSLAVLVVLVTASLLIGSHLARNQLLGSARTSTQALADTVVAPLVTPEFRAGDDRATATLDRLLASRFDDGTLRHVKIWSADGTILWADEEPLVGQQYELRPNVQAIFGNHTSLAGVADLDAADHLYERAEEPMLEVYSGTLAQDGDPIVVEAYLPASSLQGTIRTFEVALIGVAVGGLLLFAAATLPMALALAHRVERSNVQQARFARHGLLAADLERRRLAERLHDEVIPDLASIGFLLPVVERGLEEDDGGSRDLVHRAEEIIARDLTELRSALADIHPPDLTGQGLVNGLEDLADTGREAGLAVQVEVSGTDLPVHTAALAYRVAREGMRNVLKHTDASEVHLVVTVLEDRVEVSVADDGPDPVDRGRAVGASGHLGLVLLADTLRDLGGDLALTARAPRGAVLTAWFPLVLGGAA
jgi:signal transduction histidine kinase